MFVIVSLKDLSAYGQACDNTYSLINIKAKSFETFKKITTLNNGEIVSAGDLVDFNKAAHLAKYSSSGNLLWSYFYTVNYGSQFYRDFFNNVSFNDITGTSDGAFIAAGNVCEFNYKADAFKDTVALITKIDKYGATVWTKLFRSDKFPEITGNLSFNAVIETSNGDIIAYLATDNGIKTFGGIHSYDKVVCLDAAGNIKWSTLLYTALFDAGGVGLGYKRAIIEDAGHNIVIARAIHKTELLQDQYNILPGNLHFLSLDHTNGKLLWETNYAYPVPNDDKNYTPNIFAAGQLAGGGISFITNLYIQEGESLLKKPVQVIIDQAGNVKQVFSFSSIGSINMTVIDAANDALSDTQLLLLDAGGERAVIKVDGNGNIMQAKGYHHNDAAITASVVAAGFRGLLLLGTKKKWIYSEMIVTDKEGNIDCAAYDIIITATNSLLKPADEKIFTDLNFNYSDRYGELGHQLKREDYSMQQNTICAKQDVCCHDVVDSSIENVTICEGMKYMLPDSSLVQDSGLYYVSFKTALGCDSLKFYKIKTDKDVTQLSIGNDTCFAAQEPIELTATSGFGGYTWMNTATIGSNKFTVTTPGEYYVGVSNTCGSKTDSLSVFELCDFPIYMPTAFTPNFDGLNDVFRISPDNKNRLINFIIYDRWGNLVFRTSNPSLGWDGRYKNEPLAPGNYLYRIEMVGISGKPVSKKGWVMLLR